MPKVAIVTDSTAYLPIDLIQKYNIRIAPMILLWGDDNYRDGVSIQPGEFYTRLKTAKVMPSTSQATPGDFTKLYTELLANDYQILTAILSEKLSGTMASALQARDLLPAGAPIEIVDTQTTAMAMGFVVLEAAKAASQGASLAECKAIAEQARQHVGVVFAVDTLEFLHRGGRIGGASRFLGTALNIKPILEVTGGRVEPVERVRTRKKSLERLLEIVAERIGGRSPVRLATLHANAPEDADWLLAEAQKKFGPVESILAEVSPVVGTHTGPGTAGLAFMAGM
jgi:DegV family protein with EDD domain